MYIKKERTIIFCKLCGIKLIGRPDSKFCSNKCRVTFNNNTPKSKELRKQNSLRVCKYFKQRKHIDPVSHILFRCRNSASVRKIEFNLEKSDIIIPEYCPLLGLKLQYDADYWNTPSIDRIDSSKGYVKGNIWIISRKANTMKQDVSIDKLKLFANNILKIF